MQRLPEIFYTANSIQPPDGGDQINPFQAKELRLPEVINLDNLQRASKDMSTIPDLRGAATIFNVHAEGSIEQ